MKVLFRLCLLFLLSIQSSQAQSIAQPARDAMFPVLEPSGEPPLIDSRMQNRRGMSKEVTDTVLLPTSRRSSQRGIIMNTSGSITGASQYYESPQPITLLGFEFFAYKNSNANPAPAPMKAEVYEAVNHLPVGSPLFSTVVDVPYSSTNTLNNIRRVVQLPVPLTLHTDYVLTIELTNNEDVVLASSNWETQDGDGDYYAGGKFSGSWLSSATITVSGVPFDADFFIQPYVRYTIETDMELSTNCLTGTDTVAFSNTSSPVFTSKFYNKLVVLDTSLQSVFRWDFGDGSPIYNGFEPNPHIYQTVQNYTVTKRDSLLQWSLGDRKRQVVESNLNQEPVADFTFSGYRNITFINQSQGIDKITWIFTDSTYSTEENPSYYFFGEGAHDVTLIIENGCGSDTITKTVQIAPIGIEETEPINVTIYPNPASDQLTLSGDDLHRFESIQLVDVTGRVVLRTPLDNRKPLSLFLGDLARGWYLLQGTGAETSFSRPVVLK